MRPAPPHPALLQINPRLLLHDLARTLGRPATLDDLPEGFLEGWEAQGFHWIWLLGAWQTGDVGRAISRSHPVWRAEFARALPEVQDDDIVGSCFAIRDYSIHDALGGPGALARFRDRLHQRNLRLMLDFVPNHVALDHRWVEEHPEYFVAGTEADLRREPASYTRVGPPGTARILAHGRDPHFDGWSDTLQLDYSHPEVPAAMEQELLRAAALADGLRCDMAMLQLPEVFERTWGRRMEEFWTPALARLRERQPQIELLAEVYWDLESRLIAAGFDHAYDKRLYDHLRVGDSASVRSHLLSVGDQLSRRAHFLENHDEPRAAAVFGTDQHRAAAVVTATLPGLRFFQEGQLEGRRTRVPIHLRRRPNEAVDPSLQAFYSALLAVLRRPALQGRWQWCGTQPAWDGNPTHTHLLAWTWSVPGEAPVLVAVNVSASPAQGWITLEAVPAGPTVNLTDQLGAHAYERSAAELRGRGLYLDVPAWKAHVFTLE